LNVSRADLATIFVDIFDPGIMFLKTVSRDTNDLDISLLEVWSSASYFT
jgi:hypothetical protein